MTRPSRWLLGVALLGTLAAWASGETERSVVRAVLPLLPAQELGEGQQDGAYFIQAAHSGAAPGRVTVGGWGSGRQTADVSLRGPTRAPETLCRPQRDEVPLPALPGAQVFEFTRAARAPDTAERPSNSPFADRGGAPSFARWRVMYPAHCLLVTASVDGEDPERRQVRGRVRQLAEALHQQMVASGLARGRATKGKPLCDEALRFFGLHGQPAATHVRRDLDDLDRGFRAALAKYEAAHPGEPPYFSVPPGGSVSALNWLFAEGGALANLTRAGDALSEDFVFTDRDEAKQLQARSALYRTGKLQARPGTEGALLQAIITTSEREQRPLEPGDVFHLALEQTRGDGRLAMLLAHNTLRSLSRGADGALTGISQDLSFSEKYLARLRGGPLDGLDTSVAPTPRGRTAEGSLELDAPPAPAPGPDAFAGDNAGPWYHLFGTAYFELQVQAELGSVLTDALSGEPGPRPTPPPGAQPETRASRVANALEQYYREYLGGNAPDPEKYCFNVWGAKLGARFAAAYQTPGRRRLGPVGARTREAPKRPVDPLDPGLAEGTPRLGTPDAEAARTTQLREARAEKDAAFDDYTRLVTTGGPGDVAKAKARYQRAAERLKALEARLAP